MKNCNGEKYDTEYYNLIAHKGRSEIKLWVIQFLSRLHVQDVNYKAKTLDSLIFQCNSLEIKILNTYCIMDIYLSIPLSLLRCSFVVLLRHLSTVEFVSRWNWRIWHADRRPWNSRMTYVVVLIRCSTCVIWNHHRITES